MKKKISVIIGGTRGIGKEIFSTLKKRGDTVFNISRNNSNNKNDISADLNITSDLKLIKNKFKNLKIDNLIFSHRYRGSDENDEIRVMVQSTNNLIKLFLNHFKKNSAIVILSSIGTRTVADQNEIYHLTRAALESLTKYYACRLGSYGVRVNCIQPGKTLKKENIRYFKSKYKKNKKIIENITPLKKMGTSRDIANVVDFLTSEKSTFVTGVIMPVDGGLRLVSQEYIAKLFD